MMKSVFWSVLMICSFSLLADNQTANTEQTKNITQQNNPRSLLHQGDSGLVLSRGWRFCPVQNFQPEIEISVLDCQPINLPTGWESVIPDYDGYGLLINTIPSSDLTYLDLQNFQQGIHFSRLRDADKVFMNGHLVGETGEFPPNFQKAVLHSRIYTIPNQVFEKSKDLEIRVWVYNDARPGGITGEVPVINRIDILLQQYHNENDVLLALLIITLVFSLLHFIYFVFYRHSKENIFYSLFLLAWTLYLFTYSNFALKVGLSLNVLFRTNVALFFVIFSSLPLFAYQFFNQKIPRVMQAFLVIPIILIPVCYLLPEPRLVYYPLELVELLTLPALILLYWMLIKSIRAKLAYAKSFTLVLFLYTLFGGLDIVIDFLQPSGMVAMQLYGPWSLILLSIAMTVIISHKNLVYYKDATVDRMTGTLRFEEFLSRLQKEFLRADRENKIVLIAMIDLDNFKQINDSFGHMQGDAVLKLVAEELRSKLRQFDLICRYGGDEFCVSATFDNREEALSFIERLTESLNKLSIESKKVNINISVTSGVSFRKPEESSSPLAVIERADQRLIDGKIKQKGRAYQ